MALESIRERKGDIMGQDRLDQHLSEVHMVQLINRYMLDHYDENISLEQIAAQFGYETGYFSKLMKRFLGASFIQYRNWIRVEIALVFLRKTNRSITDVANYSGFSTVRNFNQVFLKITGFTPTQVRQMDDAVLNDALAIPEKQMAVRRMIRGKFLLEDRRR